MSAEFYPVDDNATRDLRPEMFSVWRNPATGHNTIVSLSMPTAMFKDYRATLVSNNYTLVGYIEGGTELECFQHFIAIYQSL